MSNTFHRDVETGVDAATAGDEEPLGGEETIPPDDLAAVVALMGDASRRPLSALTDEELKDRIAQAEEELALLGDREGVIAIQMRALDYLLENPESALPPLWSSGARALDQPNLRQLLQKFTDARS
ncbi:MAG: hypothetical protein AAGD33_06060 [Actinomycetota bacterium]